MQILNAMWIITAVAFVNIAGIGNSRNQFKVLAELRKHIMLQYNITETVVAANKRSVLFFLKESKKPAIKNKIAVIGIKYAENKE